MSTRLERRIVNINFASGLYNFTPSVDRAGTVYTNRGATFQQIVMLPKPNQAMRGWHLTLINIADRSFGVKAVVANTLITMGNATATQVMMLTAGQMIGGEIVCFCDGTSWIVMGATNGVTYTVT